jgi:hypothetical protein
MQISALRQCRLPIGAPRNTGWKADTKADCFIQRYTSPVMAPGGVAPGEHGVPRRTRRCRSKLTYVISSWGTARAVRGAQAAGASKTADVPATELVPASELKRLARSSRANQAGNRCAGDNTLPPWIAWILNGFGTSIDWSTYYALNQPADRGLGPGRSQQAAVREMTDKERVQCILAASGMIVFVIPWSMYCIRLKLDQYVIGQLSHAEYLGYLWDGCIGTIGIVLVSAAMIAHCIWPGLFDAWARAIKSRMVRAGWLAEDTGQGKDR